MVNVFRLVDWYEHNDSRSGWLVVAVFIMVACVLSACGQNSDIDAIKHTRDPSASDLIAITTTATADLSTSTPHDPTNVPPMPTVTLKPSNTPTVVDQTPTPTQPACDYEYFFEPSPEVCPDGASQDSIAAEQPFERGFMIWIEETDSIYVFEWEGLWKRYDDTFEEGQPENDPTIVPPAGLYQPFRGFGKAWRENPQVQVHLGWAKGRELAYESAIQRQNAEDLTVTFIRAFNGQVLALTNRDSDGGDWVIAAS